MNDTLSRIQQIQSSIQDIIDSQRTEFLKKYHEIEDPDILEFVNKYIEWYTDDQKTHWCYDLFSYEVIYYNDKTGFFGNLSSFIGNYLYDDSYFKVNWYKNELIENKLSVRRVKCNKADKGSFPFIESDHDGGTQDPKVLLEAMRDYEEFELKRLKKFERLKNRFK